MASSSTRNDLTVDVLGVKEVADALKGLPYELAQKVLAAAVSKQVAAWRDVSAQKVPVSQRVSVKVGRIQAVSRKGRLFARERYVHSPGTLRRSIKVKKMKTNAGFTMQEARYGIVVVGHAFYWRWVEFGSVHNQPPKAFFRDTFNTLAELSVRAVAGDVQKGIERYFKRVKKGKAK